MKNLLIITLFVFCYHAQGQAIFSNELAGSVDQSLNPYTIGQLFDANISVSGIGRSPGISPTTGTNNRYNAKNWDSPDFNSDDYFYFTLTPNLGYEIDFISFVYTGQISGAGPVNFSFRSSLDNYTNSLELPTSAGATIDLSSTDFQNITTSITFRIYAWGANSVQGTFSVNDFIFNGTVMPTPCTSLTTIWDGATSTWSNGVPTNTSVAVINGDYDTTSYGNIEACRLTVNSGTLIVTDRHYVEVQNELINNANIIVRSEGAFVQINDSASITGSGTTIVEKQTAPANNWYEYTYWSSPVENASIANGLSDAQSDRRFLFSGQNYLDALMESNNSNTYVAGQDGVDDNGNDWQRVNDATVMTPGVGYASTHNRVIFESSPGSPKQFTYTFEGTMNNGEISVPVYRNDSETNDTNWNLIGNPYASAIDADLFLTTNPDVDGAIYFWSQNTPPNTTANGNEVFNFSDGDYAVINSFAELAGGDGVVPNRFIPSCQAFFVAYNDSSTPISTSGSISEGSVTFNNLMRVRGEIDNNQFFKSVNTKKPTLKDINKLRIDLTSNNGVFSQIVVGYVDGATNYDDGSRFDVVRTASSKTNAILYSRVLESDTKYSIQGKSEKQLKLNEKIELGFLTNIKVPTTYKLSLNDLHGAFMNENSIYLKDRFLNKTHNLLDSGYTFTSEVGEFNDRFEIVFKSNPSEDKIPNNNTAQIRTLGNDMFEFLSKKGQDIKSISIYDLLGNSIYNLKGYSSNEIFELPKLGRTIYITRIELDNGSIVTKKFIVN